MSRGRRLSARLALLALLGGSGPSCQSGYILEQALAHFRLARSAVPLAEAAEDPRLSEAQRSRIPWIPRILDFARLELGLDPGDAYETLVDTGGEPVSHVVIAASAVAIAPCLWCFPVAGCVPYKGYFSAEDAQREAARLRRSGFDVVVLPVSAFSTLGWFSDPILSTMLDLPPPELAELLIHEIVHRTLYFPDHTTLNESLATHVSRRGTEEFLRLHPAFATAEELEAYRTRTALLDQDRMLVDRLRWDLESLYRSSRPREEKLRRKAEIFRTAQAARGRLLGRPSHLPASNAYVLAVASYHDLVGELERLESRLGGQPRQLMAYLLEISEEDRPLPAELETPHVDP